MIKRLFTIATLTFLGFNAYAQYERVYEFSKTETGYKSISDVGTLLPFEDNWDDEVSEEITMPFKFSFQNEAIKSIQIETNGSIILNGKYNDEFPFYGQILGMNSDYHSKGRGKIYTHVSGDEGNRHFIVEYNNIGFLTKFDAMGDDLVVLNDSINFQIWLYEADNSIEYKVGKSYNIDELEFAKSIGDVMGPNNVAYFGVGLAVNEGVGIENENIDKLYLQIANESEAIDQIVHYTTAITEMGEMGLMEKTLYGDWPAENTSFKYTPNKSVDPIEPEEPEEPGTSITNFNNSNVIVSPNPSHNGIFEVQLSTISSAPINMQVIDITGKSIINDNIINNKATINIEQYPAGNYILHISNGVNSASFNLIKK